MRRGRMRGARRRKQKDDISSTHGSTWVEGARCDALEMVSSDEFVLGHNE